MKNLKNIAMLIDADNTQLSKLESVIQEISANGRIVVKRAYGNWRKGSLKNWENELKRLAIKAEQQFDYVAGKNATDMALVIDTLDLLHSGIYDAFVIVASDSDYTPLAIKMCIRDSISDDAKKAMAERKTPIASFYANLTTFAHYYEEKWFPYTMPISDIYGPVSYTHLPIKAGLTPR